MSIPSVQLSSFQPSHEEELRVLKQNFDSLSALDHKECLRIDTASIPMTKTIPMTRKWPPDDFILKTPTIITDQPKFDIKKILSAMPAATSLINADTDFEVKLTQEGCSCTIL